MKTIFSRIFSGQLISAFAILALMSFIFAFAIRTSIVSWNNDKKSDIENLMLPVISKTYRLSGSLSQSELSQALRPYITDSLYVYVLDSERSPVLLIEQGASRTLAEVEKNIGPLSSFLSLNKPAQIKEGDEVIAYLCVDSIDFLAYKANRIFIATMQKAVAVGIVLALALAVILSQFISRVLSKRTSALADTISSPSLLQDSFEPEKTGVSELDKIAEAVSGLKLRLRHESQLRNQWMLDVSHDLRTPLTAVKMQIEGMKDGVLLPDSSRFEALYGELNLIERLVLDLQDLSRFESPEMKITPSEINISSFVDKMVERFSLTAERKNIKFTVSFLNPDGVTSFVADDILMQRCVSNVLNNAFQYTVPKGSVSLTVAMTVDAIGESKVSLTVRNSGAISQSDLPHIFDRLYRGDHSRSTAGSGLGLSIVKAIVQLHKGEVSVENCEGSEGSFVQTRIVIPTVYKAELKEV